MSKSLLAFDTDRIKSYVFATDKLKEIRGASAILDELNRVRMIEVKNLSDDKIYANGGGGLFIIDSNRAKEVKEQVEKLYRETTGTASITGVCVELPSDYKAGDDIQTEFRTLSYRLRVAKDSKAGQSALVTHPYLHFCDSCGTEYAEQEYTEIGETVLLCASCRKKRDRDEEIKTAIHRIVKMTENDQTVSEPGLWARLIPTLAQQRYGIESHGRPEDFNDLADMSHPKNYIGLIYADGDSMGKELERLKTEDEFRKFSETVDGSVYEAVVAAIVKHLPSQDKTWPFDILLLGGDDLVMVTPADKVLEVGLTVMEQFSELTQKKLGKPLNLSVGIAIAHANYPFGQLRRLAESTLKFAKKEGAKRRQSNPGFKEGLLNFVVVNSANHLEFGEYYREVLKQQDDSNNILYRTQRPYTTEEVKDLLAQIETIRDVPHGKLHQLRSAVFKSKKQCTVDAMMITLRSRKATREKLLRLVGQKSAQQLEFPWIAGENNIWVTPILDIVDLIDFVSAKEDKSDADTSSN